MKILIAAGVARQQEGGVARVVLSHAKELEKLGHSVDCWFLEDILGHAGTSARFEGLQFAIGVALRLRREKEKYTVVNLHAPWGCCYGVLRRLFRWQDVPPYVMTMQGIEERYVHAMIREQRKGRASHFRLKNRLWHRLYHQRMYRLSIQSAAYAVVANREAWAYVLLRYNRDPEHVWFIPNGTEEQFFIHRDYAEKGAPSLLYVGTWLDRKGIYYLVEAFQELVKELPKTRLTIAGCLIPAEGVKLFFDASLHSRIDVIPLVKREQMPDLYARHDSFVCPSLMEGMPLTLLEAMATGMPAVATETSGMVDVIEDEVNGLLVPPADSAALQKALGRLCRSADLRKELGQAAQETARRYTWEKVTRKLEKVLALAAQNAGR